MSEFVAVVRGDGDGGEVGITSRELVEQSIREIAAGAADVFDAAPRRVESTRHGFLGLVLDSAASPVVAASSPGGHLLVKGVLMPSGTVAPLVAGSPEASGLLASALRDPVAAFRGAEGPFAALVWNEETGLAYARNDTAATLNLYAGTFGGVHWVTTSALLLARALRLRLEPGAVMELLGRGAVMAPASMFSGLRRVGVGEAVWIGGHHGIRGVREWLPYASVAERRSTRAAVDRMHDLLVDRMQRVARLPGPLAADLTGGYDTRVVCGAAYAAGLSLAASVTGPPDDPDVGIARQLAARLGWSFTHFDPTTSWDLPIDRSVWRQLVYRTSGELPPTAVYQLLLTRPWLARTYAAHLNGTMGELLRSFPWSQEFAGAGRRRPADVGRLLRYRFLQDGPPMPGLYRSDWFPAFVSRLSDWAREIASLGQEAQTNQQCDAIYLWKMTGHVALYTTASSGWLPTVAPLAFESVVSEALSIPWHQKVTSNLQRTLIARLSPVAASVPTVYGSSARPISPLRPDRELLQAARQARLLISKLDRVYLRGRLTRAFGWGRIPWPSPPFVTADFRRMMHPAGDGMLSRAIYNPERLGSVLTGADDALRSRLNLLARMATVESLCREIGHELGPSFLAEA